MAEEFLSLSGYTSKRASTHRHPALAVHRKRHRRSRILNTKDVHDEEATFKVWGTAESSGRQSTCVGPSHLRDMITLAVTSMFGDEGSDSRFKWDLVAFNDSSKVGHLKVFGADIIAFRAAIALLPLEEGRIYLESM